MSWDRFGFCVLFWLVLSIGCGIDVLFVMEVPLNDKETMMQRQISIEKDETETGMEALEEPLKAKMRRESRQGIGKSIEREAIDFFFAL